MQQLTANVAANSVAIEAYAAATADNGVDSS